MQILSSFAQLQKIRLLFKINPALQADLLHYFMDENQAANLDSWVESRKIQCDIIGENRSLEFLTPLITLTGVQDAGQNS